MKKILFLSTFLLSNFLFSQGTSEVNWAWSNSYGNQSNSVANQVVVDDNFDIYVSGTYNDTLPIDGDTLISPGSEVVFLAKFDQLGNRIWATSISNSNSVQRILLDANNNVRLLLNYSEIGTYSGLNGSLMNSFSLASGTASTYEVSTDFEIDAALNTYTLSYSEETQGTGLVKCEIDKYNSTNAAVWSKSFDIGYIPEGGVYNIALDSNNNLYISGTISGSFDIDLVGNDIVTTVSGAPQSQRLFLAKYNDLGEAQWLDAINTLFVDLLGMEVNLDDNSLYFTGYQIIEEVFHSDTLSMDTTNQQQIFLSKYDLDGNYAWSKSYPLATKSTKSYSGASWGALGSHLSIANNGNVYLKGSFTGSIIFYNDTLIEDTTSVVLGTIADDSFIAKFDGNGNPIWGKYAGNSGGYGAETGGFWVDLSNDVIYLVGYYASPNNLIKAGEMLIPTNSTKNIFVAKEEGPVSVGIEKIQADDYLLLIYPNPSNGIYYVSKSNNTSELPYSVVGISGNVILSGTLTEDKEMIDLSQFSEGIYFFQTEMGSTKLLRL